MPHTEPGNREAQLPWPLLKRRPQPPRRRLPHKKGRGMDVKTPSPTASLPQDPKGKGKSISPYKKRSQSKEVVEVANEVPKDRDLEVQAPIEVESGARRWPSVKQG